MVKLDYYELKVQTYFQNKEINKYEARDLFKFRTHMVENVKENFKENFKGNHQNTVCDDCKIHEDSQEKVLNCEPMKSKVENLHKVVEAYANEVTPEVSKIVTKLLRSKQRERC